MNIFWVLPDGGPFLWVLFGGGGCIFTEVVDSGEWL